MKKLSDVELFLFDMDGTVYIADTPLPGAFEALNELKRMGKKVAFFTNNSSKSLLECADKLRSMGYDAEEEDIYTSSMVTCEYIKDNYKNARVFVLGNDNLKQFFHDYGITLDDRNPDLLVVGFDTSLTYGNLYKFCCFVHAGVPYIATHPDITCPSYPAPLPDVGAILKMIEASTDAKPVSIMGKPFKPSAEGIKKRFSLPADKIAMVGDRLYTDILFGVDNGMVSVLVLTGDTDADIAEKSPVKADYILGSVRDIPEAVKSGR